MAQFVFVSCSCYMFRVRVRLKDKFEHDARLYLEWDLILRFEGLRMGINSHGRDLEWDLSP